MFKKAKIVNPITVYSEFGVNTYFNLRGGSSITGIKTCISSVRSCGHLTIDTKSRGFRVCIKRIK
jgi:hypothetical protein